MASSPLMKEWEAIKGEVKAYRQWIRTLVKFGKNRPVTLAILMIVLVLILVLEKGTVAIPGGSVVSKWLSARRAVESARDLTPSPSSGAPHSNALASDGVAEVTIEHLRPDSTVDESEQVHVVGAITGARLYPVVTAVETGVMYVAGPALHERSDGSYSGSVRFGDPETKRGAKFVLEIVKSQHVLPQGPFDPVGTETYLTTINVQRS